MPLERVPEGQMLTAKESVSGSRSLAGVSEWEWQWWGDAGV